MNAVALVRVNSFRIAQSKSNSGFGRHDVITFAEDAMFKSVILECARTRINFCLVDSVFCF